MQYDADVSGEAANLPVDGPLFVGAEPVFWLALLIVLVAATIVAWLMGRSHARPGADGIDDLWDDIDRAARQAMQADSDALPGRAAALRRVLEARLGRTLALSGGLSGRFDALIRALDGEAAARPQGSHRPAGEAAHGDADGRADPPPPAPGHVTILNPSTVIVNGDPEQAPGSEGGRLSIQDRNDALRLAVGRFTDHWRHRADRVRELRAVHAELSVSRRSGDGPHLRGSRADH